MAIDEGYIKYQCYWQQEKVVKPEEIVVLNQWRDRLFELGLIGKYANGIGFGNLSYRLNSKNHFLISGTQTGRIPHLTEQHYTKVIDFNWDKNYVTCTGEIKASSESLTHGALYAADSQINAVVHVHNLALWQKLMDKVPTTDLNCAYGTPEMAESIMRLAQNISANEAKIIIMKGHKEGIITFGKDIAEAGNILLDFYQIVS